MAFLVWTLVMLTYSLVAWRFRLWDEGSRWIDIEPKSWMYALATAGSVGFVILGLFVAF